MSLEAVTDETLEALKAIQEKAVDQLQALGADFSASDFTDFLYQIDIYDPKEGTLLSQKELERRKTIETLKFDSALAVLAVVLEAQAKAKRLAKTKDELDEWTGELMDLVLEDE